MYLLASLLKTKLQLPRATIVFTLLMLLAGSYGARSEIKVPHMLSDHAVLQRDRPIHVWGWADPGESIQVSFHEQKMRLDVDELGRFSGWLNPEKAGGPYVLTFKSSTRGETLTVQDLLVGDVWFASGQSNMEMPLRGFGTDAVVKDSAREIAAAEHHAIRLLRFEHRASDSPADDVEAVWNLCDPKTAADFSAVAYFFGREISEEEHVAVGLIDATWGGTPVDSWMSLGSIARDASLMPVFRNRARFLADQGELHRTLERERREDEVADRLHQPRPTHPWHPDERSWSPSLLYNGMVAPATGYTIRGFLWYQGETDSSPDRGPMYARVFPALISDWRESWAEGMLPFLYVQISSFDSPPEIWGAVRDAQRQTLALAGTAMAVSLDVGSAKNVHPPDKQTVGHRLALGARAVSYGEKLEWSGPMYRQATRDGTGVRVWFDHADGLKAQGALKGFELAAKDGHFVPATAKIAGSSVLLRADGVSNARMVRYGWANVSDANLYNSADLPASTFVSAVP